MNNNTTALTQNLFTVAQTLSIAINSGFLHREHATTIFKNCLKVAGMEVPTEDKKIKMK